MLHSYVIRFDVTVNFEKYLDFRCMSSKAFA